MLCAVNNLFICVAPNQLIIIIIIILFFFPTNLAVVLEGGLDGTQPFAWGENCNKLDRTEDAAM